MTFLLLHPNHGVVAGRKLYARWKAAGFDAFDRVFSPVTCLLAAVQARPIGYEFDLHFFALLSVRFKTLLSTRCMTAGWF
jgi:hypothetical protein